MDEAEGQTDRQVRPRKESCGSVRFPGRPRARLTQDGNLPPSGLLSTWQSNVALRSPRNSPRTGGFTHGPTSYCPCRLYAHLISPEVTQAPSRVRGPPNSLLTARQPTAQRVNLVLKGIKYVLSEADPMSENPGGLWLR